MKTILLGLVACLVVALALFALLCLWLWWLFRNLEIEEY